MNGATRMGWAVLGCLAACGDGGTEREISADPVLPGSSDEGPALTIVSTASESMACPAGGQRVDTGFDGDGDGALSDDELVSSTWSCRDPAPGAEPPHEEPVGEGEGEPAVPDVCIRVPEVENGTPEILRLDVTGPGYFGLLDRLGEGQGRYFSRSVSVHLDARGTLVDEHGFALMGYEVGARGGQGVHALESLPTELAATRTSLIFIGANLDATAGTSAPWDPTRPASTSNFSTSSTVFDSLGLAHPITFYFSKVAASTWAWHAMANGGEVVGGTSDTAVAGGDGVLAFTTDGALASEQGSLVRFDFVGATSDQRVEVDFGTSIELEGGEGFDGSTSFAAPSTTNALRQDGSSSGSLAAVVVGADGSVRGSYSNRVSRDAGRLALARFPTNTGATYACDGIWVESGGSDALFSFPDTNGRGTVVATLTCAGCSGAL